MDEKKKEKPKPKVSDKTVKTFAVSESYQAGMKKRKKPKEISK